MARPFTHDPEQAVEAAKAVFWERGYDNTSLEDLSRATGLGRSSLYNDFGSKRALYLRTLDAYGREEMGAALGLLLDSSDARGIGRLFDTLIQRGDRRGCLLCNAAVETAVADPEVAEKVRRWTDPVQDAMTLLIARDHPDWPHARRRRLGAQILATYMGLQVMLRGGWPMSTLTDIRNSCMQQLSENA